MTMGPYGYPGGPSLFGGYLEFDPRNAGEQISRIASAIALEREPTRSFTYGPTSRQRRGSSREG